MLRRNRYKGSVISGSVRVFHPAILRPSTMSCGALDALYAFAYPWLVRIGVSLTVVDSHLRSSMQQTLHAVASTASLLLSFESLVIVSFITFLFLGAALCVLVLWPLIAEPDDYDACESGLYYADGMDGRWSGMAVPVIIVGRSGRILVPTRPHRSTDKPHHGQRQ